MHIYKLFKLKCVLAVCTDKNLPFFYLLKSLPLSQIEPISAFTHTDEGRSLNSLIDSRILAQTALSYLRPALSELSSVSSPEQM